MAGLSAPGPERVGDALYAYERHAGPGLVPGRAVEPDDGQGQALAPTCRACRQLNRGDFAGILPARWLVLIYVKHAGILTYMVKTQVYLQEKELEALRRIAGRSGRSIAALVREAIRTVWLRPESEGGPIRLWDGRPRKTSIEHDSIYDDP